MSLIGGKKMIENNPTNVEAAFEMLLEEVEAEIVFYQWGRC